MIELTLPYDSKRQANSKRVRETGIIVVGFTLLFPLFFPSLFSLLLFIYNVRQLSAILAVQIVDDRREFHLPERAGKNKGRQLKGKLYK